MPFFEVIYGEGDGARFMGWNYCWVRVGPMGYNGERDWLNWVPVLENEFALPW